MSTSPHEGVYLYSATDISADRFCSTGVLRDGVMNSALHKADSAAQHRATWMAPAAALWVDDSDPFLVPYGDGASGALTAGVWYMFPIRAVYAPKVRAGGKGYRARVYVAGRSSAGHDCDFGVVVLPRGVDFTSITPVYGGDPTWPTKLYSDITSTTVAALTADDANRYMDIEKRVIDRALELENWHTLTDTGGNDIAIRVPVLEAFVIAKTANVTSTPELHGFGFHEVIGDT